MIPEMFEHQKQTCKFLTENARTIVASDPGTGKTRGVLEAYNNTPDRGRMLVLAPLSIMQAAWGDDIDKFLPHLTYSIARATKREQAFHADTDIVIINHDGVKWVDTHMELLQGFTHLAIDEVTAYKNPGAKRTSAMLRVSKAFPNRTAMSGTLYTNTVLDLFMPTQIVDDGEALGTSFYRYRHQVCMPRQVGPDPRAVQWRDKPNAVDTVGSLVQHLSIRHRFEDCITIPEHTEHFMFVDLPRRAMDAYTRMMEDSMLLTEDERLVNAVHAGVRARKLLQICTGSVYDTEGEPLFVHSERYELVIQLIQEREHCVVAFNWKHERNELERLATNAHISHAFIDGSVPEKQRPEIIKAFQNGEIKALFCHPQSASHGITLTRGTSTIWASPTHSSEQYQQFNARIVRAGQDKRTETIRIASRDTKEEEVYDVLSGKLERMSDLLNVFHQHTRSDAA